MTPSQKKRSEFMFRPARDIGAEALSNFNGAKYYRPVRETQEAVELFLKGKLLEKGIEPAKTHDLEELAAPLRGLNLNSSDLAFLTEERIPSFYGGADIPPDQAYEREDGERCVQVLRGVGLI